MTQPAQRTCSECGHGLGPGDHRCGGCRRVAWGARCTSCNLVGFWSDFPDDCCGECGRRAETAMTARGTNVCGRCARLLPAEAAVCFGCGDSLYGVWVGIALAGLICAGCAWGFGGALPHGLARAAVVWGGSLAGGLMAAFGAAMLIDCRRVSRPAVVAGRTARRLGPASPQSRAD